jgi:hypothetical protein
MKSKHRIRRPDAVLALFALALQIFQNTHQQHKQSQDHEYAQKSKKLCGASAYFSAFYAFRYGNYTGNQQNRKQ